jgi:hypothetical protein
MPNRETQVAVETGVKGNPTVRGTQTAIEIGVQGNPHIHATQICVEIGVPRVPNPPPQLILEMMMP